VGVPRAAGSNRTPRIATGGSSGGITPQKGPQHLVDSSGDSLVCVRYRYDAARRKRIKIVELIAGEANRGPRFAPDEIVAFRVAFTDVATRRRVKLAGGRGAPPERWQLRFGRVVALGLRRRIVTLRHPGLDAAGLSEKHPDADTGQAST
jgi:hypothetical protein